jgi:hypothetical protein
VSSAAWKESGKKWIKKIILRQDLNYENNIRAVKARVKCGTPSFFFPKRVQDQAQTLLEIY